MASENCVIAAFHAILMSQILRIGSCFNDLIPSDCNRNSEIRELLKLPNDLEIYADVVMLGGGPAGAMAAISADEATKLLFAYDYENRVTLRIWGTTFKPSMDLFSYL